MEGMGWWCSHKPQSSEDCQQITESRGEACNRASHRPQSQPSLPIPCSQTSSLQNDEAIGFWGLNHLPRDICFSGPRKALHDPSPWSSSRHRSASGSLCFLSPSVENPGSPSASTLEESRKGAGSRPLYSLSTHGIAYAVLPTSMCWLCLGNTQISPGRQETGLRDEDKRQSGPSLNTHSTCAVSQGSSKHVTASDTVALGCPVRQALSSLLLQKWWSGAQWGPEKLLPKAHNWKELRREPWQYALESVLSTSAYSDSQEHRGKQVQIIGKTEQNI